MSKSFSASDVASHNKADNLWIIVDQDVYDLTKFQDEHPGGKKSKQIYHCLMTAGTFLTYHLSPPACRRQGRQQAVLEIPQ